ncbi:MAG: S-methyl-5'-thioinosine phosphorylase [Gammaproteobacteria bacterium]|nr:S-methyl-5'-thioinosine phosphorylase [Gammaproteobacteria bacterium]
MLALITGTALQAVFPKPTSSAFRNTPYGAPSGPILKVPIGGNRVYCLNRHGLEGQTAAHLVNYRANIWALKELGITRVIATATVGGINPSLDRGDLVVPDQVIDYTYGREQTFVGMRKINHFDFTFPFDTDLRDTLIRSLPAQFQSEQHMVGTYGVTQGPRFETAAEIDRFRQDGCDLVGMTLMPEAALAREAEIRYAALCLVVNPAAGVEEGEVDIEDTATVTKRAIQGLGGMLERVVELIQ